MQKIGILTYGDFALQLCEVLKIPKPLSANKNLFLQEHPQYKKCFFIKFDDKGRMQERSKQGFTRSVLAIYNLSDTKPPPPNVLEDLMYSLVGEERLEKDDLLFGCDKLYLIDHARALCLFDFDANDPRRQHLVLLSEFQEVLNSYVFYSQFEKSYKQRVNQVAVNALWTGVIDVSEGKEKENLETREIWISMEGPLVRQFFLKECRMEEVVEQEYVRGGLGWAKTHFKYQGCRVVIPLYFSKGSMETLIRYSTESSLLNFVVRLGDYPQFVPFCSPSGNAKFPENKCRTLCSLQQFDEVFPPPGKKRSKEYSQLRALFEMCFGYISNRIAEAKRYHALCNSFWKWKAPTIEFMEHVWAHPVIYERKVSKTQLVLQPVETLEFMQPLVLLVSLLFGRPYMHGYRARHHLIQKEYQQKTVTSFTLDHIRNPVFGSLLNIMGEEEEEKQTVLGKAN